MGKYFSILVIVFTSWQVCAQINYRDSVLANERALDRPLNVHGGQIRISGGYGFSYATRRYDPEGESTKLMDDGFAYARHRSFAEVKLGITEHLQLTTLIRYQNSLARNTEIFLVNFPAAGNATKIYETENAGGFDDVYVGLDFRIPFKTNKLDVMISAGSFLPTAESKTPQPNHSLEVIPGGDWNIVYRNFDTHGNGTLVPGMGVSIKYRFKNAGVMISGTHHTGLNKEVEGLDWTWHENNGQFEYSSSVFKRGNPDRLHLMTAVEFQPTPYFNLFLQGEFFRASKGWREWEDGIIEDQNFSAFNAGIGFELIITPRLWFRETVTFPLQGENMDNGVQFYSTLSYNLFVKH